MGFIFGRAFLLGALLGAVGCGGTEPVAQEPEGPGLAVEYQMKRVPISMYMTSWCPVCRRARHWLSQEGYKFAEYDVEADADAAAFMVMMNPYGTVPTFDVDGYVLIGFQPDLLREAIRRAVEDGEASSVVAERQ